MKVVEGFTRNFTEAHKMPGSNPAVTPNNLLQKNLRQKNLKKRKNRNRTVLSTNMKNGAQVQMS